MSRPTVTSAVMSWVVMRAIRPFPIYRRWRDRQDEGLRTGNCLGGGLLREHIVAHVFDFTAVCGQPVTSVGGSAEHANCRACRRFIKRAVRRKASS